MAEWQPIDTAPRDGTWIIGHVAKWDMPFLMAWSDSNYFFYEQVKDSELFRRVPSGGYWVVAARTSPYSASGGGEFEPTHWMPLPDLPHVIEQRPTE